jgi:N utilization substance protein A
VPDDQLSLAIGRRGQNVRLASILTGWDIDILTEAEESERRAEEFTTRSALFIEALDVDDVIAHLLVAEGFSRVEEIAETPIEELNEIEGFEEEISTELQNRAQNWIAAKRRELEEKSQALGIQDDLLTHDGLRPEWILKLGESEVKSLDDLADLAADELLEILGENAMTNAEANELIMGARAHWFAEEDAQKEQDEAAQETAESLPETKTA